MSEDTALVPRLPQPTAISRFRLVPASLGEAMEMAKLIAGSDLCPKSYKDKPADCIVAYEFGSSLGLSWMQALQYVAVINGRPSIWGDAASALIAGQPECERFHEEFTGTPYQDDFTAVCIIKRKHRPDEVKRTFSVGEAKTAKLWGKTGRDGQPTPWITYPKRMLQMRARGFAMRDSFPDKLSGLILAEEAMDYPNAIDGSVVSSEIVEPRDPLAGVSEGLRDNLGKAFTALSLSPAQQLVEINKHFVEGVSPDEAAEKLLLWLRDEYAKRKTGKPVSRESNGKKTETKPEAPATPAKPEPPPETGSVTVPATEIPFAGGVPQGEIF